MNEHEWTPPEIYKIDSKSRLGELSKDKKVISIVDPIDVIKEDLFDMQNPDKTRDQSARDIFYEDIEEQGYSYGNWIYYPWNGNLVRLPESDDYYNLRTFRNRNLITQNEQSTLRHKKIAAFGLSVGSNVVDSAIVSGIGDEYLLFDPDRLTPTNLNRIRLIGSVGLGLYKTTVTGRKIADLDPYTNQKHFSNGYDNFTDDILRQERPDAIIEEMDNLEAKTKLRDIAKELGIPLIMVGDAGDSVILDVERHDLGDSQIFNGKISRKDIETIRDGRASKKDIEGALMKLIGLSNLSPRLIESSMLRGKELTGFPQLGTTAGVAGAIASVALRDIFLDREVTSGTRHAFDIRKAVGSKPSTTIIEDAKIFRDLIRYRRG